MTPTVGGIPQATGVPTERYPPEQQWPKVMQSLLGNDYEVVVDALSGRTTDAPDPGVPMAGAALDGSAYLPSAIAAHFPLDLVVIMLGTNAIASFAEVPEILEVRALPGQRDNIVRFEDRDTGMG